MNTDTQRPNGEPGLTRGSNVPRNAAPPKGGGKKISQKLVVVSAAAVLAVYATGYLSTQAAAAQVASVAAPTVVQTATVTGAATEATVIAPTTTVTIVAPSPTTASKAVTTANTVPPKTATSATTSVASSTAVAGAYKDGTYSGAGSSRHGGIQATVVVKNGRIVSAQITSSTTRYPTSRIAILPNEVVAQQTTNVNYVSGATDSSMAYRDAVASALAQAA